MTYSELILSHSPSNYWRLNDASGLTAADSAGSAPGTISGGVTLAQAGALADGTTAMLFNGTTGKIVTAAGSVTLPVACTVEAWLKTTSTAQIDIGSNRHEVTAGDRCEWGVLSGAVYMFGPSYLQSVRTVHDGAWHHAVYVLNGATLAIYIDGTLDTSGGQVRTVPSVRAWSIGWDPETPSFWNGSLDEVAIYPRALTPTEIADHYAARLFTGAPVIPLAGCDHTTVWSRHLATLAPPTVESERAYLATRYGEPGGTDMSTLVSRWLQEISCGTAVAPPAAPTLSTVAPNTGTQGTMVTVTLTGTTFVTGATGVSVNGVGISVVNIQVTSPTTLTADLAIAADAPPTARTLTVSTAGGTATQAFTVTAPLIGLALMGDRQYTAPAAADSVSLTPSASAWVDSAYVTLLDPTPAACVLTGVTLATADTSVDTGIEVDIATGAAGLEVVIATIRGYSKFIAENLIGPTAHCRLPIPIDNIGAGVRVSARMRKGDTDVANAWQVAITYLQKPLVTTTLTTAQPQKTMPAAATGITITSGASAWVNGTWTDLRTASGPALVVTGVVLGAPSIGANGLDYELDLATGAVGVETLITTVRVHTTNRGLPSWLMFPNPLDAVPAATRVSARLRSANAGAVTMIVSLMVLEQPL